MIELGLQRITQLLASTPLKWRAIHVAGTNGKGSICAYISRMLEIYNQSAYRKHTHISHLRHGRFTSPHLINRHDCITIEQSTVSEALFRNVEEAVHARARKQQVPASEFEVLTATAFEIFTRQNVDIGIVEVGMGGRLDATNVIGQGVGEDVRSGSATAMSRPPPLVTAISSIGLDHQAFLGDTLTKIAQEKAGVIKPRVPVVCAPNEPEVSEVIESIAQQNGSPIYSTTLPASHSQHDKSLLSLLNYLESHHSPSTLPPHTRANMRVAFLSTCLALQQLGRFPIDISHILKPDLHSPIVPVVEMFQVPWITSFPGRLQRLSLESLTGRRGDVLLDGAHNAQSALALASEIERLGYRNAGPVTWVLAASGSKDAREILRPLLKSRDVVFAVEFGRVDGMPWVRAQSAEQVREAAERMLSGSGNLHVCGTNVLGALKAASKQAGAGPMVVAGSLYLVGDVLRLVRDQGTAR